MEESSVSEFQKELEEWLDKIWDEPPAEVKNLTEEPIGAYGHRFPMMLYAFFALKDAAAILWFLRGRAKAGTPLESLKEITKPYLEGQALFIGLYGLPNTGDLLKKASMIVPKIKDSSDYVDVLTGLCVYLNKMGYGGWVDLAMDWARVSCAFEILRRV